MSNILSRFYDACPQAGGFDEEEVIDFLSTQGGRNFLGLNLKDAIKVLLGNCPITPDWRECLTIKFDRQAKEVRVYDFRIGSDWRCQGLLTKDRWTIPC